MLRMSALWLGLEFFWVSNQMVFLPSRVEFFAPAAYYASYYALIKAAGAIVTIATQLTIGFLSDHAVSPLGKRRPFIMRGILWGCAAITLFVLAPNYWMLFCMYLVFEFFINSASVPFQSLLPDLVPKPQVGRAGAIMGSYHLAGNLVGILVMVAMAVLFGNRQLAYMGSTLPMGFAALLLPLYLLFLIGTMLVVYYGIDEKGWAQQASKRIEGAVMEIRALSGMVIRFARTAPTLVGCMINDYKKVDIRSRQNLLWLAISRFVIFIGFQTFNSYALLFVEHNLNREGWLISLGVPQEKVLELLNTAVMLVLGLFILGGLLGALCSHWLQERFGKRNTIITGMILAGVMIIPLIFTSSVWVAVGFGIFMGAGWGIFLAADWAFATLLMPKDKAGSYMGLWDVTTLIPQFVALIIAAPIRDGIFNAHLQRLIAELGKTAGTHAAWALGNKWLFATVIVYFLLGLWLLRRVREERRPGYEQQP